MDVILRTHPVRGGSHIQHRGCYSTIGTGKHRVMLQLTHPTLCQYLFIGCWPIYYLIAKMSTDQDWIRTDWVGPQFYDWVGVQFFRTADHDRVRIHIFKNWWIRTGANWENLCWLNVIILTISIILVFILLPVTKALLGLFCHLKCIQLFLDKMQSLWH